MKHLYCCQNSIQQFSSSKKRNTTEVLFGKNLKSCFPYGIVSVAPTGQRAVVLPLDDGEIGLGVIADRTELEEGEVMLYSKGGASVILKNNGKVLINGEEY